MSLPVFMERTISGFRASITTPLSLTAEGLTEDEALANIANLLDQQQSKVRQTRAIHVPNLAGIVTVIHEPTDDVTWAEYQKTLSEVRRITNAVPDDPE